MDFYIPDKLNYSHRLFINLAQFVDVLDEFGSSCSQYLRYGALS